MNSNWYSIYTSKSSTRSAEDSRKTHLRPATHIKETYALILLCVRDYMRFHWPAREIEKAAYAYLHTKPASYSREKRQIRNWKAAIKMHSAVWVRSDTKQHTHVRIWIHLLLSSLSLARSALYSNHSLTRSLGCCENIALACAADRRFLICIYLSDAQVKKNTWSEVN